MSTGNWVTITPVVSGNGTRAVKALLGESTSVAEANGGWTVLSRPKRVGFTVWDGYAPIQMELSIVLDGLVTNTPQDADNDALWKLMRTLVGEAKQPSPVKLTGNVPFTSLSWVIQSIEADGDSVIRRDDGKLLRISSSLTLLEYVEADVLVAAVPSPVKDVVEKTPTVPQRTYTIKRGDTLSGIATKYLGDWSRYREIVALNGIRDPNRVPVGTVLRLP